MPDRLEVRLHGQPVGWITRGSRRERIEVEWIGEYTSGPVTLTESFGSVRSKAPTGSASSFFGGYALEGRQREQLTQRRGIRDPTDLYAMFREFGSSIAGAVTIADPDAASRTEPRYEPIGEREIIQRLRRAASDGIAAYDRRRCCPVLAAGYDAHDPAPGQIPRLVGGYRRADARSVSLRCGRGGGHRAAARH